MNEHDELMEILRSDTACMSFPRRKECLDLIESMQAVIDKLPVTKDGVAVTDGDILYQGLYGKIHQTKPVEIKVPVVDPDAWGGCSGYRMSFVDECYSTESAAQSALKLINKEPSP